MQTSQTLEPSRSRSFPFATERAPSVFGQLTDLADRVVDYARAAKVQRFRYCRRPAAAIVPDYNLLEAIENLRAEVHHAERQPICQTLAVELLTKLSHLGGQPPCENNEQQETAIQIITIALLALR
ncbi:hypothetical protein [Pelagicoccus albus]|uniref:Uncharacterized protein n=1 Tax=Pelagicoccus albus TaxID=415222 RepID=A0A7X1E7A3_9BACT|nr:hypothetical protein [Pelagicoccus albus]MBC2604971.1 hypothetical protein [Pelagicoccus albus]